MVVRDRVVMHVEAGCLACAGALCSTYSHAALRLGMKMAGMTVVDMAAVLGRLVMTWGEGQPTAAGASCPWLRRRNRGS